jgi:hypothetical protein
MPRGSVRCHTDTDADAHMPFSLATPAEPEATKHSSFSKQRRTYAIVSSLFEP